MFECSESAWVGWEWGWGDEEWVEESFPGSRHVSTVLVSPGISLSLSLSLFLRVVTSSEGNGIFAGLFSGKMLRCGWDWGVLIG